LFLGEKNHHFAWDQACAVVRSFCKQLKLSTARLAGAACPITHFYATDRSSEDVKNTHACEHEEGFMYSRRPSALLALSLLAP
jgi:hypothetical protein